MEDKQEDVSGKCPYSRLEANHDDILDDSIVDFAKEDSATHLNVSIHVLIFRTLKLKKSRRIFTVFLKSQVQLLCQRPAS